MNCPKCGEDWSDVAVVRNAKREAHAATPAPLRYQPSRDGDMDPDPHGEWVRYDTDDGWQERGNPGDPATPAPLDVTDCDCTPGFPHKAQVAATPAPLGIDAPDNANACPSCGHDGLPPLVCERCGHRWYATPAPLDGGHDLVGIRLRGYREGRAEALGDVREFVDESHDRAVAYAKETT